MQTSALLLLLIPLLIPRSVHVDVDCVLLGKLEFAYYQKWDIGSLRIPAAAIVASFSALASNCAISFWARFRTRLISPRVDGRRIGMTYLVTVTFQ